MNSYQLIDSGNFKKLEQVGPYKIVRPSPVAAWPPTQPSLWKDTDGEYHRSDKGGGNWTWKGSSRPDPDDEFLIRIASLTAKIRFTPFGHLGIFPEQLANWERIQSVSSQLSGQGEVLNLFAYSGLSTLSVLAGGMDACHLDASKGMVEWARENAEVSELSDRKVRWIVEDVLKFLNREIRRNKKYAGFILDPPTFGRGASGEVFKIEKDLPEMMDLLMKLCDSKPQFVFLTCHSAGFSPIALRRILEGRIKTSGKYITEELIIPESTGRIHPAGSNCIFHSDRVRL